MVFRLRVLAIIRLIFEGAETYFLLIKYRNIEGARAPPAPPLTPSLIKTGKVPIQSQNTFCSCTCFTCFNWQATFSTKSSQYWFSIDLTFNTCFTCFKVQLPIVQETRGHSLKRVSGLFITKWFYEQWVLELFLSGVPFVTLSLKIKF